MNRVQQPRVWSIVSSSSLRLNLSRLLRNQNRREATSQHSIASSNVFTVNSIFVRENSKRVNQIEKKPIKTKLRCESGIKIFLLLRFWFAFLLLLICVRASNTNEREARYTVNSCHCEFVVWEFRLARSIESWCLRSLQFVRVIKEEDWEWRRSAWMNGAFWYLWRKVDFW